MGGVRSRPRAERIIRPRKFNGGSMRFALVLFAIACAAETRSSVAAEPDKGIGSAGPTPAPRVSDTPSAPGPAASAETRDLPLRTEPWGPEEFRDRRARLMAQMKTGVGLVLSADRIDAEAGARQDPAFLDLTRLAQEAETGT